MECGNFTLMSPNKSTTGGQLGWPQLVSVEKL